MSDLHDVQRQIVGMIAARPVGCVGRASLMDAADKISLAIEVEARGAGRTPITHDEIMAGRTDAGGWTKATLARWGVSWPPPKGWRKKLIQQGVPA